MTPQTRNPASQALGRASEVFILSAEHSEDTQTTLRFQANVIGVDPGSGGRAAVNAPLLAELLARWHARIVVCEFVSARPGEGPTGAFSFGRSRGIVEGVCGALSLPIRFLTPPAWKRAIGLPPGRYRAKDAARSEAIRRWPAKAALFARVRDDGRAEAALIGLAGLMREARQ
jgi:crossover junction endodeoxyribonuclease RuvC